MGGQLRDDVTTSVKSFYEATPFPNYDEFDNLGWLVEKARKGVFAQLLDDQVPPRTRILECGCGTGQMCNFLSVASRTVFGTDMSLPSLGLGASSSRRRTICGRVHFMQMNLFRPCFKSGTFDLVISKRRPAPYLGSVSRPPVRSSRPCRPQGLRADRSVPQIRALPPPTLFAGLLQSRRETASPFSIPT